MVRILFFLMLLLSASCAKHSYEVEAVCEVTEIYNYIVKWDIYPYREGQVTIYSSLSPNHFNRERPVAVEPIGSGRADLVIKGSLHRRYFLLVFDEDHEIIVGVRGQNLETVHNFRDLGGYKTQKNKHVRWGAIYRSGSPDSISNINARRIAHMSIHSWVDLRRRQAKQIIHENMRVKEYKHFPITAHKPFPDFSVMNGSMRRDQAVAYMEDVFRKLTLCTQSIRSTFELLKDPNAYPVVLSCDFGTIQTSLVSALLLYVLDVPEHTIFEDYLLNNRYFEMNNIAPYFTSLNFYAQDAITTMLLSEESYLEAAVNAIKQEYGSIDHYLEKEIGITDDDKEQIRSILLQ